MKRLFLRGQFTCFKNSLQNIFLLCNEWESLIYEDKKKRKKKKIKINYFLKNNFLFD